MRISATHRKIKRLREQGRKAAVVRWQRDREKRAALDAKDPVQLGGKIVERLVRIIDESRVIERTFYEHDRPCDWKRKRREVLRPR